MAFDWDCTGVCKITEDTECWNVKLGLYHVCTCKTLNGVRWLVEVKQWIICNSVTTVCKTVDSGRFCQVGKGQFNLVTMTLMFWHRICSNKYSVVEASWSVKAHVQKPDFVFRRNGRVRLNRRGRQLSQLLAAEVYASAIVMLDTPCSEVVWSVLATRSIRQFPLHFPLPCVTVCHHISAGVCQLSLYKTCASEHHLFIMTQVIQLLSWYFNKACLSYLYLYLKIRFRLF